MAGLSSPSGPCHGFLSLFHYDCEWGKYEIEDVYVSRRGHTCL